MDKLSLEIEFPIDNERLRKESAEAQAAIGGVGETAEKVSARVDKQINEAIAGTEKQAVVAKTKLEELQQKLGEMEADLARKTNPMTSSMNLPIEHSYWDKYKDKIISVREEIAKLQNPLPSDIIDESKKKIDKLQDGIDELANAGKKGFDEIGGAVQETGGFMTMISRILPGIGLAGFFSMAATSIMEYIASLKKANEAQKAFNKTKEETANLTAKEIAETDILILKVKDENISQQERISLLNELISKSPTVLGALNLQNIATSEGTFLLNEFTDALRKKIELQQLEKGYIESLQREADISSGRLKDETNSSDFDNTILKVARLITFTGTKESTEKEIERDNEIRQEANLKAQKLITQGYQDQIKAAIKGQDLLNKAEDDSLNSLQARLTENSLRLRNLQKNESAKDLLAEKVSLEQQIKQRELLLGLGKHASKADKEMDRSVSAAQSMQQRIYDLKAEYTRKAKTKDEEELDAVRDKFIKMAKEAELFNKDKKNKVKVSVEGLDEIRDAALADLTYKQDTERLKISLSEQKKLYQDYEEYKVSLGKDKADEKYRDLIDTERSHLENLRAELTKVPVDDPSGSQVARKEELEKQIREEETLQLKKFNDLLKENQSYQDKVRIAIETFEAEKKRLTEAGAHSEVETLTTNHELALVSLNESHVKQLGAYKKLFDGIELLSNAQAKKVLDDAKAMLANTDMPEDLYLKALALIKESEKALGDRIYDRVAEIGGAFDEMANNIGDMNEGLSTSLGILGDMLHAVSTVGSSIGSIKTGIADYGANKENAGGGALGTISAVAGIAGPIGKAVGAVAGLAKGIVGVFKAAKESRIQAEKELAAFDAQKYNAEFEINAMYRDRLRTQNEINKSSIDGLKETNKLLKEQQKEVIGDADKLFAALQGEQFVSGKKTEKYGGFLGIGKKTKTVDIMGSLADKSFEDIEKLFISNQLTDRAKELFQQLEKIKKEGVDVDSMLADNTKAAWLKITGTTSESLAEGIIKGFEKGYRKAPDFINDFSNLMSGAAKSFFTDFVENKEVDAFYKKFAEMSEDGVLNEAQRAELKGVYDSMIGRINNKYEDLKAITGDDFMVDPSKKATGVSGGIQSITQTQADALGGQVGGIHMAKVQSNEMQKKHLDFASDQTEWLHKSYMVQVAIEKNTGQTATNTNRLEKIESTLVSMEKKMTNDNALRGAGMK